MAIAAVAAATSAAVPASAAAPGNFGYGSQFSGGGGGAGLGGAIFNMFGSLTVTNSTLAGNTAQGGAVQNASGAGTAGDAFGGAIFNLDSLNGAAVTLVNDTLAGNYVISPDVQVAILTNAADDVYNLALGNNITTGKPASAGVILQANILAGSSSGIDLANTANATANFAAVLATGPNLTQQGTFGSNIGGAPFINDDPLLAPLANNGGPTPTMEVLAGSPVLANPLTPGDGAPPNDQRGVSRGTTMDLLGAYQATEASELAVTGFDVDPNGFHVPVEEAASHSATVTVVDSFGKTVYDYAGTVQIGSTGTSTWTAPSVVLSPADNGVTTFTGALDTVGVQAIIAGATDSSGNPTITGEEVPIVVVPALATQTNLVSGGTGPHIYGQQVMLKASVKWMSDRRPPTAKPAGMVSFWAGDTLLGTAALNSDGAATLPWAQFMPGSNEVTAKYNGGTDSQSSTSHILTLRSRPAATATALASSQNPSMVGEAITLTATVSVVSPGSGTPTGMVAFYATVPGAVAMELGSAALATVDGKQQASLTLAPTALSSGKHALIARYTSCRRRLHRQYVAGFTPGRGYRRNRYARAC